MGSFLAGIGSAVLLAAGTLWVLEAGTITMVERSDGLSTRLEGVWHGGGQREGMIPETADE
jgi:hypothetical protein